eukprot:TRINITY_DN36955_c0_g1_i1.p1 TRINITY_DN36955_c0_g1~~TRINITY_DN36955_c0_g1_i1.p1  ORF type:complete len:363 (+),score=66.17 TRINITY_DN36955_c0_g1_i1:100-1188(+)
MDAFEHELDVDDVRRALKCIDTLSNLGIKNSTALSSDLDHLRGVSVVAKKSVESGAKCPNGHKLLKQGPWVEFSQLGGWCDKCGVTKGNVSLSWWRCESKPQKCNYDLCSTCYALKSKPSVGSLQNKKPFLTPIMEKGMEQQRETAVQSMLKLISLGIPFYNTSTCLRLRVLASRNSTKTCPDPEFTTSLPTNKGAEHLQQDITATLDVLDNSREFSKKIRAFISVPSVSKKDTREKVLQNCFMQFAKPSCALEMFANKIANPRPRHRRPPLKVKNDYSTASDVSMGMFDIPSGMLPPSLPQGTGKVGSQASMLDWLCDNEDLIRITSASILKCEDIKDHSESGCCCGTAAAFSGYQLSGVS